jgi:hypothetical protein
MHISERSRTLASSLALINETATDGRGLLEPDATAEAATRVAGAQPSSRLSRPGRRSSLTRTTSFSRCAETPAWTLRRRCVQPRRRCRASDDARRLGRQRPGRVVRDRVMANTTFKALVDVVVAGQAYAAGATFAASAGALRVAVALGMVAPVEADEKRKPSRSKS